MTMIVEFKNKDLEPPEDTTVTTLWIGGVEPDITQDDILGACYAYGHIVNLHIARAVKCAFLEYASREMAEYAAKNLHNALILRGHHLQVKWAKPKPIADPTQVSDCIIDDNLNAYANQKCRIYRSLTRTIHIFPLLLV